MQIRNNIFKIEHNNIKPKQGRVLVSVPFLRDIFFKKSIILLTDYNNESGAFGFILNKPYDYKLHEILDSIPESDIKVSYGGPMSNDSLHFIHTLGEIVPGTIQISNKLYWGGDFNTVLEMIRAHKLNDDNIRFFLGYSGWGKGQLEKEIIKNSWLVSNVNEKHIMKNKQESFWNKVLKNMGEKYEIWSNFPEDPTLN
jgi:putative transcriptional regulator